MNAIIAFLFTGAWTFMFLHTGLPIYGAIAAGCAVSSIVMSIGDVERVIRKAHNLKKEEV